MILIKNSSIGFDGFVTSTTENPSFNPTTRLTDMPSTITTQQDHSSSLLSQMSSMFSDLANSLIDDFKLNDKDQVCIMINSLGATPLEELYIISKRVHENFSKLRIKITKTYVGRYATSMEMAGMSITTLKLNDNLKKYLFAKSECTFWNN